MSTASAKNSWMVAVLSVATKMTCVQNALAEFALSQQQKSAATASHKYLLLVVKLEYYEMPWGDCMSIQIFATMLCYATQVAHGHQLCNSLQHSTLLKANTELKILQKYYGNDAKKILHELEFFYIVGHQSCLAEVRILTLPGWPPKQERWHVNPSYAFYSYRPDHNYEWLYGGVVDSPSQPGSMAKDSQHIKAHVSRHDTKFSFLDGENEDIDLRSILGSATYTYVREPSIRQTCISGNVRSEAMKAFVHFKLCIDTHDVSQQSYISMATASYEYFEKVQKVKTRSIRLNNSTRITDSDFFLTETNIHVTNSGRDAGPDEVTLDRYQYQYSPNDRNDADPIYYQSSMGIPEPTKQQIQAAPAIMPMKSKGNNWWILVTGLIVVSATCFGLAKWLRRK